MCLESREEGSRMHMQQQCVICAKPLSIPRRADARYCRSPSTCRVQAYRARSGGATAGAFPRKTKRLPSSNGAALGARTMTQLATFRALVETQQAAAAQDPARRTEEQEQAAKLAQEQIKAVDEATSARDAAQKRADALADRLRQQFASLARERDAALSAEAARSQELDDASVPHPGVVVDPWLVARRPGCHSRGSRRGTDRRGGVPRRRRPAQP